MSTDTASITEDPPGSVLDPEALAAELSARGVELCSKCGLNPVRDYAGRGAKPSTCEACHAQRNNRAQRPPRTVRVTVGAPRSRPKGQDPAELVRARAQAVCQQIAVVLYIAGQEQDSAVIAQSAEPWSMAVGELSRYEPWIVQLAKGGEVSGRAVAWLGFTVATASMLVPVMLNHNLIPEGKLRQLVGQVIATAETAQAAAAAAPSDT